MRPGWTSATLRKQPWQKLTDLSLALSAEVRRKVGPSDVLEALIATCNRDELRQWLESVEEAPWEPAAPWGRRTDGTPRRKPGPKRGATPATPAVGSAQAPQT